MYMLDTNMCIYIIKKRPIGLLAKFNRNLGDRPEFLFYIKIYHFSHP